MGEGWKARDLELDAIAAARSADPFAVLGPHETPAGWVIRVFAPDAVSVRALTREGALMAELPRRKNDAFEALIPAVKERPAYRVEVTTAQGAYSYLDPYAFGPALGCARAPIASSTAGLAPSSFITRALTACCSPYGRPMRRACPSSATSIGGTDVARRCGGALTAACGRSSSPN